MSRTIPALALAALTVPGTAFALLGGPALETDDAFYPGIGKYRDAQAIIRAALEEHERVTGVKPQTDRDKTIAVWRWMMEHLYHCSSRPIEFLNNVAVPHEEGSGVYDSLKFLYSYQFAICYASSTALAGMMEAAGYTARGRGLSGHTVPEVFYSGDWHYLDHDMAGTCFEADHKTVASVDEILRNPSLLDWDYRKTYNVPQFPWDGGPGSRGMKDAFSRKPENSTKYNDHGIAVHPSTVMLRHGERFTRFFNYDRAPWGKRFHWTGLKANKKYFPTGPARDKTFVWDPPADGSNDGRPRKPYTDDGRARYGNGLFEYEPDLSNPVFLQEALSSENATSADSSPRLRASGGTGTVTIRQWTPYVICGAPETFDCWGKVSDAVVVSGTAVGDGVKVAVSVNGGLDWDERPVSGEFREDFSMLCRARYQYLLRLTFPEGSGLDALKVRTVTMCAPSMMPHLHDGTTRVTYSASDLGVVFSDPDLSSGEGFKRSFAEVKGFRFTGENPITRARATDNSGSWLTMKLEAPGPITRVGIYAFLGTRTPPRPGCVVALQYSTDGKDFKDAFRKTLATDADHWRHWFGATAEVKGSSKEVFLRLYCKPNGTPMRLCRVGGYAWYRTGDPPALTITHVFKSGSAVRKHVEKIPAGVSEKTYSVSCGSKVQNISVSFEVPAAPTVSAAPKAKSPTQQAGTAPGPGASARKAKGLLSLAKNYIRAGMNDKAEIYLRRIIKEFPQTREAEEAAELLGAAH